MGEFGKPVSGDVGGVGADPAADETITGVWSFDQEIVQNVAASVAIGKDLGTVGPNSVAIGLNASAPSGLGHQVSVGRNSGNNSGNYAVCIGYSAGVSGLSRNNSVAIGGFASAYASGNNSVAIGRNAGYQTPSSAYDTVYIGHNAGYTNAEPARLLIHSSTSTGESLTDALIDGRFSAGTGYRKGIKINGDLEATDELVIRSPNGTRWNITVDDTGALSAIEATTP